MKNFFISCITIAAIAFGSCAFAGVTNSGVMTIASIKAQWSYEDDVSIYHYKLDGDWGSVPGQCRNDYVPWSGDRNINTVMHEAYLEGARVRLNVTTYNKVCAIALVQTE